MTERGQSEYQITNFFKNNNNKTITTIIIIKEYTRTFYVRNYDLHTSLNKRTEGQNIPPVDYRVKGGGVGGGEEGVGGVVGF